MKRPVWVTGATGFLGHYVMAVAEHDAIGWGCSCGPEARRLDLIDSRSVVQHWHDQRPSGVIHLAACANASICESDPGGTAHINVGASEHLAQMAAQAGVPFVLASTDLVFDGDHAPYRPHDTPRPLSSYGRQKAEAERRVQAINPTAVVARLPLMYDWAAPGTSCFVTDLLTHWEKGRVTPLFADEYRTPALAREVAKALWSLLDHPGGVVHVGGPESIDRLSFATLLVKALGRDAQLLRPARQADLNLIPRRPVNVSLTGNVTVLSGPAEGIALMTSSSPL